MERADDTGGDRPAERARYASAFGVTLVIHMGLFSIFSFVPEKPLALPKATIPVKLVILEAPPSPNETKKPEVEPIPTAPIIESVEPSPSASPPEPTEIQPEAYETKPLPNPAPSVPPMREPVSILSTEDAVSGELIPDRWRLPDGARIPLKDTQQPHNPNLEALSKTIECFGFDADCAVQRKDIFAEEQLTDTDLVWVRSYAHSGLSDSSLYGLSEAQIRERLGIPTAGKNGFIIFPGIAIDGPWWDALHGVNKSCEYGLGINDAGERQLMKRCAPLKPTSKDRIDFIPKPLE